MKKVFTIGIMFLCLLLIVPSIAISQATFSSENRIITEKIHVTPSLKADRDFTYLPYNETLYAELMLPGYYTPQDWTAPDSVLLTDPVPVQAYVICDDDMFTHMQEIYWWRWWQPVTWDEVFMWAWNILEGGDDPLETNFQIDFRMEAGHYTSWNSPSTNSLNDIFWWANETFTDDMINASCDVLVVMSGISDSSVVGLNLYEELALRTRYEPQANTFQHEASHFYNCPDNQCSAGSHCIMTYTYFWQQHRDWCSDCTSRISTARYRFG
jgi:hypothetical protein